MAEGEVGSGNAGLAFPPSLCMTLARWIFLHITNSATSKSWQRQEHLELANNDYNEDDVPGWNTTWPLCSRVAAASLQFPALHSWARQVKQNEFFQRKKKLGMTNDHHVKLTNQALAGFPPGSSKHQAILIQPSMKPGIKYVYGLL